MFYIFLIVIKSHVQSYANNELSLLTATVSIQILIYIYIYYMYSLLCCTFPLSPKTIKNMSMTHHIIALGDMFLHPEQS